MSGRRTCKLPGCTDHVVGRRLCRKHYQAAWKAGDFANHPLPPRARDRKVCPTEHKHATSSTCYIQHQCRCDPCMDAHSERERRRKKLKAYGRFDRGLVDAAPVREHMMALAEYGIGYKRAAELAGVGITAARTILWGRQDPGPRNGELQKQVKRETAEALLSVQPVLENLAGGAPTTARATVRRIHALIAFGWSQNRIAAEVDLEPSRLSLLLRRYERSPRTRSRMRVSARTARAVAAAYEWMSLTPPPQNTSHEKIAAARCRNLAAARGWPLPMDWEAYDNDFDRPKAVERSRINVERRAS